MSRPKFSRRSDFPSLLRGWECPVLFDNDAVPVSLQGIPDDLRYCFIASGELLAPLPYESPRMGHTHCVGGIYVLRHAPDDPKPFNRDDYVLVPSCRDPEIIWLDGPHRHPTEHWADEEDVRQLLSVCVL